MRQMEPAGGGEEGVVSYPRASLSPPKRGFLAGGFDGWVRFVGLAWLVAYKLVLSWLVSTFHWQTYTKESPVFLFVVVTVVGAYFLAQIVALMGIGFGKRWAFWWWTFLTASSFLLLWFDFHDAASHGRRFHPAAISDLSFALDTAIAAYCVLRLVNMRGRVAGMSPTSEANSRVVQ